MWVCMAVVVIDEVRWDEWIIMVPVNSSVEMTNDKGSLVNRRQYQRADDAIGADV